MSQASSSQTQTQTTTRSSSSKEASQNGTEHSKIHRQSVGEEREEGNAAAAFDPSDMPSFPLPSPLPPASLSASSSIAPHILNKFIRKGYRHAVHALLASQHLQQDGSLWSPISSSPAPSTVDTNNRNDPAVAAATVSPTAGVGGGVGGRALPSLYEQLLPGIASSTIAAMMGSASVAPSSSSLTTAATTTYGGGGEESACVGGSSSVAPLSQSHPPSQPSIVSQRLIMHSQEDFLPSSMLGGTSAAVHQEESIANDDASATANRGCFIVADEETGATAPVAGYAHEDYGVAAVGAVVVGVGDADDGDRDVEMVGPACGDSQLRWLGDDEQHEETKKGRGGGAADAEKKNGTASSNQNVTGLAVGEPSCPPLPSLSPSSSAIAITPNELFILLKTVSSALASHLSPPSRPSAACGDQHKTNNRSHHDEDGDVNDGIDTSHQQQQRHYYRFRQQRLIDDLNTVLGAILKEGTWQQLQAMVAHREAKLAQKKRNKKKKQQSSSAAASSSASPSAAAAGREEEEEGKDHNNTDDDGIDASSSYSFRNDIPSLALIANALQRLQLLRAREEGAEAEEAMLRQMAASMLTTTGAEEGEAYGDGDGDGDGGDDAANDYHNACDAVVGRGEVGEHQHEKGDNAADDAAASSPPNLFDATQQPNDGAVPSAGAATSTVVPTTPAPLPLPQLPSRDHLLSRVLSSTLPSSSSSSAPQQQNKASTAVAQLQKEGASEVGSAPNELPSSSPAERVEKERLRCEEGPLAIIQDASNVSAMAAIATATSSATAKQILDSLMGSVLMGSNAPPSSASPMTNGANSNSSSSLLLSNLMAHFIATGKPMSEEEIGGAVGGKGKQGGKGSAKKSERQRTEETALGNASQEEEGEGRGAESGEKRLRGEGAKRTTSFLTPDEEDSLELFTTAANTNTNNGKMLNLRSASNRNIKASDNSNGGVNEEDFVVVPQQGGAKENQGNGWQQRKSARRPHSHNDDDDSAENAFFTSAASAAASNRPTEVQGYRKTIAAPYRGVGVSGGGGNSSTNTTTTTTLVASYADDDIEYTQSGDMTAAMSGGNTSANDTNQQNTNTNADDDDDDDNACIGDVAARASQKASSSSQRNPPLHLPPPPSLNILAAGGGGGYSHHSQLQLQQQQQRIQNSASLAAATVPRSNVVVGAGLNNRNVSKYAVLDEDSSGTHHTTTTTTTMHQHQNSDNDHPLPKLRNKTNKVLGGQSGKVRYPYTAQEDLAILQGLRRFGGPSKWTDILHAYSNVWQPGRTALNLYDHWRAVLKGSELKEPLQL